MAHTVINSGDLSQLRVCNKMCDQCLYSNHKIVSDERRDEILQQAAEEGSFFQCHKASLVDQNVMCRGYFEANKTTSLLIRFGYMLETIRFVDVMEIMREAYRSQRNSEVEIS